MIAVTFPPEIAEPLLGNLKTAAPIYQQAGVDQGLKIVEDIKQKQAPQGQLYYVIAMTSESKQDIL